MSRHANSREWVIVDCTFDLARPAWGHEQHQAAHIPGAVYADLNRDLSGKVTSTSGRHPLPEPQQIMALFSKWGIRSNNQVVVYDQGDGSIAARLWWLFRYMDHPSVAVLDGGFSAWMRSGLPVGTGEIASTWSLFSGHSIPGMVATHEQVVAWYQDPKWLLVDSRSPERFRGEVEPIDTIAGHIPGAINHYFGNNLSSSGYFKNPEELQRIWKERLKDRPAGHVIVYCGSGVTSCANLLSMEAAGLPGGLLYPGSWSQWILDSRLPIALGG